MRAFIIAVTVFVCCARAASAQIALPLAVDDRLDIDGTITVGTAEWKLVFNKAFNGAINRWIDKVNDPGETDNLATASGGGNYSQGTVFDYDVYLGTNPFNPIGGSCSKTSRD